MFAQQLHTQHNSTPTAYLLAYTFRCYQYPHSKTIYTIPFHSLCQPLHLNVNDALTVFDCIAIFRLICRQVYYITNTRTIPCRLHVNTIYKVFRHTICGRYNNCYCDVINVMGSLSCTAMQIPSCLHYYSKKNNYICCDTSASTGFMFTQRKHLESMISAG